MLRTSLIASFILLLATDLAYAACCVCECKSGTQKSFVEPTITLDSKARPVTACAGCDSSCFAYGGVRQTSLISQSCANRDSGSGGCGKPTHAQLKEAIFWTIFHEGCRIYRGEVIKPVAELRACYAEKQRHKCFELRDTIDHAPDSEIEEITRDAVTEIPFERKIPDAFHWVCEDRNMGSKMHQLQSTGNTEEIRAVYSRSNEQNPNLLAAVSDNYILKLVKDHCPSVASPPRERIGKPR